MIDKKNTTITQNCAFQKSKYAMISQKNIYSFCYAHNKSHL